MKKLKLAILALMGFSTACSTVKNTASSEEQAASTEQNAPASDEQVSDTTRVEIQPGIKLMYGVPRPSAVPMEQPTEPAEPKTDETK